MGKPAMPNRTSSTARARSSELPVISRSLLQRLGRGRKDRRKVRHRIQSRNPHERSRPTIRRPRGYQRRGPHRRQPTRRYPRSRTNTTPGNWRPGKADRDDQLASKNHTNKYNPRRSADRIQGRDRQRRQIRLRRRRRRGRLTKSAKARAKKPKAARPTPTTRPPGLWKR